MESQDVGKWWGGGLGGKVKTCTLILSVKVELLGHRNLKLCGGGKD